MKNIKLSEEAQGRLGQADLEGILSTVTRAPENLLRADVLVSQLMYRSHLKSSKLRLDFFLLECYQRGKVGSRMLEFCPSFEYLAQSGTTCILRPSVHVILQSVL